MRPENQRIKSKRAAVSRGRMYLKAKLNWLSGFPAGRGDGYVDWVSVPKTGGIVVEQIRLTGEHLHDATYTYNKLINNFPQALSGIVENKELWIERVPHLFDLLKNSIHKNQDFPPSLVDVKERFQLKAVKRSKEVYRTSKELIPVVNAFSWLYFIYPDEFINALDWLDSNKKTVINILSGSTTYDGLITVVLLFQIYKNDGKNKVAGISAFLNNSAIFEVVVHETVGFMDKHIRFLNRVKKEGKRLSRPDMPEPDFGIKLIEFIWWLAGQDRSTRRRAITLFSILIPEDFVEKRAQWWEKAYPVILESNRILSVNHPISIKKSANELSLKFKKIKGNSPPDFYSAQFFKLIKKVSDASFIDFYKKSLPVFKRLPVEKNHYPVRVVFLNYFFNLNKYYSNTPSLLAPFNSYLTRHAHMEGVLKPWYDIIFKGKDNWGVFGNILSEIDDQSLWPLVLEALPEIISYSDNFDYEDSDLLVSLVSVTGDSSIATSYMKQLIDAGKQGEYFSEDQLTCIYLLDDGTESVELIAENMSRLNLDENDEFSRLVEIIKEFKSAGWEELPLQIIKDGNLKVLNTLGLKFATLKKLNIESNPPKYQAISGQPGWSKKYPEELHPELSLLDRISVEAEKKAYKILSGFFPDREKIISETQSITQRINSEPDNIKLNTRLTNLRKRLDGNTGNVSLKQLSKLRDKLQRTIRTTIVQNWLEIISDRLVQEYEKHFNFTVPIDFFDDAVNNEVMIGILHLPKSFRDVGLLLINKKLKGDNRYLSDHAENVKFIKAIETKGIKTEYWLNPPGPYQKEGDDGQIVTISFEKDPLEILKMGQYFKTCLSPGSFNFFSAIANAADINKHVVYARDKNGKVIGRCLFVLTKEGRILTFNPYCHYNSLQFDKIMGQLADDLAVLMKTVVASHGDVPSLVVNKWYDDGSTDLCNRFSFLHYGSDFRESLAKIKTDAFLPALEKLFSPSPLNGQTIPLIIEFEEMQKRPELILPLLPLINLCDVPESTLIKTATLAYIAGETTFSFHILNKRAEKYLMRERKYLWKTDYTLLEILVEINPSAALRVLRKTRERDVKADSSETSPVRIRLLSMVHEQLGRKHIAGKLQAI